MNIEAKGSKPDQPVHLMRIVETMTPTLPKVSCFVSFGHVDSWLHSQREHEGKLLACCDYEHDRVRVQSRVDANGYDRRDDRDDCGFHDRDYCYGLDDGGDLRLCSHGSDLLRGHVVVHVSEYVHARVHEHDRGRDGPSFRLPVDANESARADEARLACASDRDRDHVHDRVRDYAHDDDDHP